MVPLLVLNTLPGANETGDAMGAKGMTSILFVRHGCTDWNRENRIQGRADIPLSNEGRCQIEGLLPTISEFSPQSVYSSPVLRAQQSAKIIAESLSLELVELRGYEELDVGDWLAKSEDQLKQIPSWAQYKENPLLATPPNGEPFSNLCQRVKEATETLFRSGHRRIVAVTHGDVIRVAICQLIGLPIANMHSIKIGLGSISLIIKTDGRPRLLVLNHPFRWAMTDE
jgi:broad specificity phosphatase PhoE